MFSPGALGAAIVRRSILSYVILRRMLPAKATLRPPDQRGITGLETAVILIAFVVTSSVLAYTVLSSGVFASDRGKEAIHSGLKSAQTSLRLEGGV